MANTLRFKRGLASGIPTGVAGEPLFTTDTFDLYIGNGTTNTRFQKYIASGASTQLLRGDGSLLTMPIVLTSPANGEVLKYNGTNWVNSSDAGITGTGAAGQVAYFTGATTQGGNNNLFWDAPNNRLGIGTATPTRSLDVVGTVSLSGNAITLQNSISSGDIGIGNGSYFVMGSTRFRGFSTSFQFQDISYNTRVQLGTGAAQFSFFNAGNYAFGSATDSGQRLQVTGDTLLKGSGATSATTALQIQNSASANMLRLLNDTTLKLGSQNIDIFPTADGSSVSNAGRGLIISTAAGSQGTGALKVVGTSLDAAGNNWSLWLSHTFGASSGTATHSGLLLNQTINQTGGANGITRGLYVNPTLTAAADWRSIEWSNNSGFGLYGAGTAPNLLNGALTVNGAAAFNSTLSVGANFTFFAGIRDNRSNTVISQSANSVVGARNLTIGNGTYQTIQLAGDSTFVNSKLFVGSNIDSGEILQVTGTAKITGATTFGSSVIASGLISAATEFRLNNQSFTRIAIADTGGGFAGGYNLALSSGINPIHDSTGGISGVHYRSAGTILFYTGSSQTAGTAATIRATLDASGNLGIGITPTEKLHVSGNTIITGNLTVDTNTLFVDATNNRVGVGTASPTSPLDVVGAATFSSSVTAASLVVSGTSTSSYIGQVTQTNTTAGVSFGLLVKGGTNSSDIALNVQSAASSNLFRVFGDGQAIFLSNLILNGTSIEQNNASGLTLNASNASGAILFRTAGSERMSIAANGNLAVDSNVLFVDAVNNEVGIGTNAPNSVLQVVGSVSKSISDVKTANYTATATDHTILCSAASGAVTITLPAASGIAGRIYVIKKTNASSGVNSVTVDGNGSETIDGSASINLACKSSVTLQCDGSNWHILSLYSDSSCL